MRQKIRSIYHNTRSKNINSFLPLASPSHCTYLHWGAHSSKQSASVRRFTCNSAVKDAGSPSSIVHSLLPALHLTSWEIIIHWIITSEAILSHKTLGKSAGWHDLGNHLKLPMWKLSLFFRNRMWRFVARIELLAGSYPAGPREGQRRDRGAVGMRLCAPRLLGSHGRA